METLVIGAGPAGLTAAYELSQLGIQSTVLEADSVVGGISIQSTTAVIGLTSEVIVSSRKSL